MSPINNVDVVPPVDLNGKSKPLKTKSKNQVISYERTVLTNLIAGACAGAVAKTVIAPLDRTKIMFQVSKTQFTYKKAFEILQKGYRKNGILSWWRGNSATMVRIVPYAAIQFTAHEHLKKILGASRSEVLPPGKRFLAGSLAGATAASCTYPLDMVRARMAVAAKDHYKNLRGAFVSIYKEEGMRTFYNGFIPTILGIMPYAGISFFVYETLKKHYHQKYPENDLTTVYRLGYGAVAGICGQTFTYPFDIVRRRMQTDGIDGKGYKYRKLLWTLKYVLQTEGIVKGYYKGMSINWIKGPVAVSVSFTTFDTLQYFIDRLFRSDDETRK